MHYATGPRFRTERAFRISPDAKLLKTVEHGTQQQRIFSHDIVRGNLKNLAGKNSRRSLYMYPTPDGYNDNESPLLTQTVRRYEKFLRSFKTRILSRRAAFEKNTIVRAELTVYDVSYTKRTAVFGSMRYKILNNMAGTINIRYSDIASENQAVKGKQVKRVFPPKTYQ